MLILKMDVDDVATGYYEIIQTIACQEFLKPCNCGHNFNSAFSVRAALQSRSLSNTDVEN